MPSNDIIEIDTPLPQKTVELIEETKNFSLYFSKMTKWQEKNYKFEIRKNLINNFCSRGNDNIRNISAFVKRIHNKQKDISLSFKLTEKQAILVSPMILGLGSEHPTEKGLTLDRNTGVPYIPASTIKGICRTAANVLDFEDKEALILKYFGNESDEQDTEKIVRGQIIFLDAYPVFENRDILSLDIMNPHYQNYYDNKSNGPKEYDSPIPIIFINIKEGTKFMFRYFFSPLKKSEFTKTDEDNINKIFEKAFDLIGFGGKTSIGYGRFKLNSDKKTAPIQTESEFEKFKAEFIKNKNSWTPKNAQSTLVMKIKAIRDANLQTQAKEFIKGEIKEKDRSKPLLELLNP